MIVSSHTNEFMGFWVQDQHRIIDVGIWGSKAALPSLTPSGH
jgi:hypothetical protein